MRTDPEIAAAVKRGELSINKGYDIIRTREKRPSASKAHEERVINHEKEGAKGSLDRNADEPTDLNPLLDRLRTTLEVEVRLSLEGSGRSGQVELRFNSPSQLEDVVERICGLRSPDNAD